MVKSKVVRVSKLHNNMLARQGLLDRSQQCFSRSLKAFAGAGFGACRRARSHHH
jgi:hypothetical protein